MDVLFLVGFGGNEVHFPVIQLADGHIVASAKQLEVDDVLQNVAAVAVTVAQEVVPQADVHDVVFSEGFEIFLALDVEALDLVEDEGFCQGLNVSGESLNLCHRQVYNIRVINFAKFDIYHIEREQRVRDAMYSTSIICPTAVLLFLSYFAVLTGHIFLTSTPCQS